MKISPRRIQFFWCFSTWIKCFPKCLWKVSREVVGAAFVVSRRRCCAIRFFEEVLVIQLLSDFQQKLFWFFKKVPLLKLHFTCAEEKYMESFFLENVNSKIALGLRSGNSANFVWVWFSNMHSKCLEEFSVVNFFWYKINSETLSYFDRNFIGLLTTFFSQFSSNSLQGVQRS